MVRMFLFIAAFVAGVMIKHQHIKKTHSSKVLPDQIQHENGWHAQIHRLVTSYLLLRIGLMGGVELGQTETFDVLVSSLLAVGLAVGICLLTLALLATTRLDRDIRISLAVHFGSVSIGTFAAATAYLEAMNMHYSPTTSAWVALMELPAILLGVGLLNGGAQSLLRLFRQDKSMLLLPTALVIGLIMGPGLNQSPAFTLLFETAFDPVLLYFLYQMGRQTRTYANNLEASSRVLAGLGIMMPLLGGTLGTAAGRLAGLGVGDAMLLGSLAASASYVAAPTAMRAALVALGSSPERAAQAASAGLTVALGVTLPFNLLVGLRFYLIEAQWFDSPQRAGVGLLVVLICLSMLLLRQRLAVLWSTMRHGDQGGRDDHTHAPHDPISVT